MVMDPGACQTVLCTSKLLDRLSTHHVLAFLVNCQFNGILKVDLSNLRVDSWLQPPSLVPFHMTVSPAVTCMS